MTTSSQDRNVQEGLLREKIDPWLTDENLSTLVTQALGVRTRCDGYAVLTGGCWNRVIAVSAEGGKQHFVVKITPKRQDADLKREFEVLRYFRAHTSMPFPEPFLLDLSGERIPGSVLVMERVAGTVMSQLNQRLSDQERKIISEEIAEHVVNLHTRQELGFGCFELPLEQRSATWADFFLPRFDAVIVEAQQKGQVAGDLLTQVSGIRGHLPHLLDIGPRGTLTHYDIWTGNVMVDFRDGRPYVSGFLDALGYYADYARELSSMGGLANPSLMQVYRERHGLDPSYEVRFNIYTFKMCLQLACMYPAEPRHMENVRRFLRQVQEYLETH